MQLSEKDSTGISQIFFSSFQNTYFWERLSVAREFKSIQHNFKILQYFQQYATCKLSHAYSKRFSYMLFLFVLLYLSISFVSRLVMFSKHTFLSLCTLFSCHLHTIKITLSGWMLLLGGKWNFHEVIVVKKFYCNSLIPHVAMLLLLSSFHQFI